MDVKKYFRAFVMLVIAVFAVIFVFFICEYVYCY